MIKKIETSCGKTIEINDKLNTHKRYEWVIKSPNEVLKTGASATLLLAKIASLNAVFFMAKKEKCNQLASIKTILDRAVKSV